jgi:hypothetical protein
MADKFWLVPCSVCTPGYPTRITVLFDRQLVWSFERSCVKKLVIIHYLKKLHTVVAKSPIDTKFSVVF